MEEGRAHGVEAESGVPEPSACVNGVKRRINPGSVLTEDLVRVWSGRTHASRKCALWCFPSPAGERGVTTPWATLSKINKE